MSEAAPIEMRLPAACLAGHREPHRRITRSVDLGCHLVPDWPAVPGLRFPFTCFDAWSYPGTMTYCPADSECSRSIAHNGVWEGFESALMWQWLGCGPPGTFMDLGCNVGWFAALAALAERQVLAYDADPENCVVTGINLDCLHSDRRSHEVHNLWITAEPLDYPYRLPVALVKIDIEGDEGLALDALSPLIAAGRVESLLIELSPIFGDVAETVLRCLSDAGYDAHEIPDKGYDVKRYAADPLAAVLAQPAPLLERDQCMAFFVRP